MTAASYAPSRAIRTTHAHPYPRIEYAKNIFFLQNLWKFRWIYPQNECNIQSIPRISCNVNCWKIFFNKTSNNYIFFVVNNTLMLLKKSESWFIEIISNLSCNWWVLIAFESFQTKKMMSFSIDISGPICTANKIRLNCTTHACLFLWNSIESVQTRIGPFRGSNLKEPHFWIRNLLFWQWVDELWALCAMAVAFRNCSYLSGPILAFDFQKRITDVAGNQHRRIFDFGN